MLGIASPYCFDPAIDAAPPNRIQITKASHSYRVKCPGTSGTFFIKTRAVATSSAKTAKPRSDADNGITFDRARANARHDAEAAVHPIAQATEPTSAIGTRIASPSNMQAAVAMPTHSTATDGV